MKIKNKILVSFLALTFLSAGCGLLGQSTPAGVVKTVNGGTDWQFINKFKDAKKGSLNNLSISALAFDPSKKERMYAGSYNVGLYKSEDSGSSWEQILGRIAVYDFVIDPQNTNNIFVAGSFSEHGKVVVSKDGGKSWEEIFNEAAAGNAVRTIAVNPQDSRQMIIGLNSGSMIKSIDGGVTWKLLSNYNDRLNKIRWQGNAVFALFRTKGLYKSTDLGESFFENNGTLKGNQGFFQSTFTNTGVDTFYQMTASQVNQNVLYVSSDKGLYKTIDGGFNWQPLPVPLADKTLPLRAIATSRTDENTVYASAGATIYKTLDGGIQWKTQSVTTAGFINYLLVDPDNPQIAYGGIYVQQ